MADRVLFSEPVVVWLVPGRHALGVRRIRDVQDGRAALHRYGIENLRKTCDSEARTLWNAASRALLNAVRNPRPDSIDHARAALVRVAGKAGALPCPDPLSDLIARGYDFAP
jgi:hypothetical protein